MRLNSFMLAPLQVANALSGFFCRGCFFGRFGRPALTEGTFKDFALLCFFISSAHTTNVCFWCEMIKYRSGLKPVTAKISFYPVICIKKPRHTHSTDTGAFNAVSAAL